MLRMQEVIDRDPSHHFHQFMTPTLPPSANPTTDVIIEVRPVLVFITWHAINQMVSTGAAPHSSNDSSLSRNKTDIRSRSDSGKGKS